MNRRESLLVALAPLAVGCARDEPGGPVKAVARLRLSKPGREIPRFLLGNNTQWIDRGDEILLSESLDFNPKMLAAVEKLAPTVLRYPGGCQADSYHWENGVGPIASRKTNERFFDKRKEKIFFGTDEFRRLCVKLGAAPVITVNVASGSAKEAAAWVAYCNQGKQGASLPPVRYWEIGNEPYLKNDRRPELAMAPGEYARRANRFIDAMKEVDPSIQILIPLRSDRIGAAPATPFQGYNDKVLRDLKADFDMAALHNAYLPAAFGGGKDRDLFSATMAAAEVVRADLDFTVRLLKKHRPARPARIAITEYNALYTIGRKTDGYIGSMAGALFVADCLRVFAETDAVEMANFWSLTGNWHFGAISNRGKPRPASFVLEAFGRLLQGKLVPLSIDGPSFASAAAGFVPREEGLPIVAGLASTDKNRLSALLLNKSRTSAVDMVLTADNAPAPRKISAAILSSKEPFSDETSGWKTAPIAGEMPLRISLPPFSMLLVDMELAPSAPGGRKS